MDLKVIPKQTQVGSMSDLKREGMVMIEMMCRKGHAFMNCCTISKLSALLNCPVRSMVLEFNFAKYINRYQNRCLFTVLGGLKPNIDRIAH